MSFHPLKAGRRRRETLGESSCSSTNFHPLKAGRRPDQLAREVFDLTHVSIPSRRVGDQGEMRGKAGKRRQKGGGVAVDLR
jgi:hypothetical protein